MNVYTLKYYGFEGEEGKYRVACNLNRDEFEELLWKTMQEVKEISEVDKDFYPSNEYIYTKLIDILMMKGCIEIDIDDATYNVEANCNSFEIRRLIPSVEVETMCLINGGQPGYTDKWTNYIDISEITQKDWDEFENNPDSHRLSSPQEDEDADSNRIKLWMKEFERINNIHFKCDEDV